MSSRRLAHLTPPASYLGGRTLAWGRPDFPGQGLVHAPGTPGRVGRDRLGAPLEQAQRGHDRADDRAFPPVDLWGDGMLSQPHDAVACLDQPRHPAAAQLAGHELAGGHRLGPRGHKDRRLLRPLVPPPWPEHHGDVSAMAPPHPCGVDPARAPALPLHGREAEAGIPPAGPGGDTGLERCARGAFPGPRPRAHLPSAPLWQTGPGRSGRLGGDDHHVLAPPGGPDVASPLPKPRGFGRIVGLVRSPAPGEGHREARAPHGAMRPTIRPPTTEGCQ